jgi:hypothetical protein
MAPRRHKPAATATDSAGNDSGVGTDGVSYGLDENAYGQDGANYGGDGDYAGGEGVVDEGAQSGGRYEDGQSDGRYEDVDAEYDNEADEDDDEDATDADSEYGEYDHDAEYEAGGSEVEDDTETFRPPTALSAIRNSFKARQKAQPATGTEEDGLRINFINKRERMIGYTFAAAMAALSVVLYLHYLHVVDTKDITLQNEYHRDAPWVLLITLGLALMIGIATLSKRRAALAFTVLLAGVANFSVIPEVGIIFLGTGLWLVFRSMRRNPRTAAAAAARGGTTSRARGSTTARGSTAARAATRKGGAVGTSGASTAGSRVGASSRPTIRDTAPSRTIGKNGRLANAPTSGRYTPPKPTRHVPPAVQPEPESSNRLSSWLKK